MKEHDAEEVSEVVYLAKEETGFSDETLAALRALGAVLEPVYREMLASGKYEVVSGKITKKESVIEA